MHQYEVIIPVRNGGQALVSSIQSALSCENASRVFLTLSDNFSTDGSPWKTALQTFPKERWRIISPPQPLGRVEHWSWAFAQAQLPWVKTLMVGDRIENKFWDWAESAISQFPQAGMLSCGAFTIDPGRAHPDVGGKPSDNIGLQNTIYDRRDFLRDSIRCMNALGSLSQVLLRSDVLNASLPFQPEFPWTADWRFYNRCIQQTPAVLSRARLVCLDRSIARLSTSWKGIRTSSREDWQFAAEQAAVANMPQLKAAFVRAKTIGGRFVLATSRKILPRSWRRFLTSATGMHHEPTSHASR